jgi:hypothetical protein
MEALTITIDPEELLVLLLVLPITVVVTGVWPKTSRTLRTHHKALIGLPALGWVISLIGGYVWGGAGRAIRETPWDWLQLLLLPLVLPSMVLPAIVSWVSGNAAHFDRVASQGTAEGHAQTDAPAPTHIHPGAAAVHAVRRT